MDDVTIKPAAPIRPPIPAEEMERRREALRRADAHNRIEGLFPNPDTQPVYEAFIRGDIELEEILPLVKAIHNRR